jgi:hypothetical protein
LDSLLVWRRAEVVRGRRRSLAGSDWAGQFAIGCSLEGVGRRVSNRWAMADNDAPDASRSARSRGAGARLVCGLGQSLGGNATAFGYSVTITASFGAVELGRGAPRFGDLIVFGLGAVVAFGGLEGLATGGFRSPLPKGSDDVILLGTALAFVSIVLAIATARGLAEVLSGAWAWFGAAFGASLVFALIESVEFMFAEWLQERRGEPVEPDP